MSTLIKTGRLLHPAISCRRCFSLNAKRKSKLEHDDAIAKTTISLGSADRSGTIYQPTGLSIGGFQFGDNYVTGSIALLPGTVIRWNVGSVEEINERTLSIFGIIYPPIELIVIGTGTRFERIDPAVTKILTQRGIAMEIQDTKNACGTYNLLQRKDLD